MKLHDMSYSDEYGIMGKPTNPTPFTIDRCAHCKEILTDGDFEDGVPTRKQKLYHQECAEKIGLR